MSPAIQEQIDKVLELEKRYKALQEAARNPVTATQQVKEALRATNIELSDARKQLNSMTAPLKEATKQTK
jgi:predicted transcriptional regulator